MIARRRLVEAVRLRVGSATPARVQFDDGLQVWVDPALEERDPGR